MSDGRFDIDAETGARVNAVNRLNAKEVRFGDTYESNAPREIRVTGVGEHPPNYADYWVDRTSYETQLRDRLLQAPVTQILAEGGFGKSSLAAWGYDHYQDFEIPFKKRVWVNLGRSQSFDRFARYVLQELGRPVGDPQANDESLMRELVLQLNDPNGAVRMLVVLDQVEAAIERSEWDWYGQFLQEWAVKGRRSAVLVTSRSLLPSGMAIELGGLSDAEGLVFFDRLGVTGEYRSALIKLAKGHPLLLKLAASWTIETYDARVDDRAIDFFTKLFANYTGDPKAGVEAIFNVIFSALPIALQNLLCGLSVYRLPIDVAMAQAMDGTATDEDLELLAGQGLLLLQETRFVLHPLVAGLVRARVTEERRRDGHERAIVFYEANYQEWDGTIESCRSELEGFYYACELGQYDRAYGSLNRCFDQLELAGEWRSLLPMYERLTREWNVVNDAEAKSLGGAWTRLGCLQQQLGNYKLAIVDHLQAQRIFDRLDFPKGKAAIFCNLGSAYYSLGDYQKAIGFHTQSMKISQAISDESSIASSLGGLGTAHYSLGNYQKAIDLHSQSIKIKQAVGDINGIAVSLSNLGLAYYSLGDYQKAIDFHSQCLKVTQAIGSKHGIASSLGGLGDSYTCLGSHQKAIDFHSQSIEISEAIGDKSGIAGSLGSLGNAHYYLGNYKKAIKFQRQSLEIERELGNCRDEASSLWSLFQSYQQCGCLRRSMHYRHQAYRIWQDMRIPLAATPLPVFLKNTAANMGETWAEQLIASEKSVAWFMLPIRYLLFALRTLLSPLTYLQKKLKIKPLWFWFCVGIAIVFLITWLKK